MLMHSIPHGSALNALQEIPALDLRKEKVITKKSHRSAFHFAGAKGFAAGR
jgi:hypothetical protein